MKDPHVYIDDRMGMIAFLMLSLFSFLPACRMVMERDIEPKRETADGVSVVAVQYVASVGNAAGNGKDCNDACGCENEHNNLL